MDNRPIGIFDSGIGGLTAVFELRKIMPNENIIYFGDTGRVPYGTRSNQTIQKYAKQDINFLLSKDVKMIIAACGTVSSVISKELVSSLPVPYTGVPIPAVQAASLATKNGKIGVIGTTATIKSGAYETALAEINQDFEITTNACPLFVPLVENGFTEKDNPVTTLVARQYLQPLIDDGVDTVILGCTHYPLIKETIQSVMGENVVLIDSGQEAARFACSMLTQKDMLNQGNGSICQYYISDTVEQFRQTATAIIKEKIENNVEKIDIESY